MPIRPLSDRVVIRRTPGSTRSGLIHLPEAYVKAHSTQGTVIATGPETKRVSVGDLVMFKSWEANEVRVDGEPVVIVFEDAVDGVFATE